MFEADRMLFDYTPQVVTAEASTLGLKPGEWPDFIAITDDDRQGFLVQKAEPEITQNGDVLYFTYRDRTGRLPPVHIFND